MISWRQSSILLPTLTYNIKYITLISKSNYVAMGKVEKKKTENLLDNDETLGLKWATI